MEYIKKAEVKIEEWLKPLPHLPEDWRKWLAVNIWWIMVIGAVLVGLSAVAVFKAIAIELGLLSVVSLFADYGWGSAGYYGANMFVLIVSLAVMIAFAVIFIMAIKPLKNGQKKGWQLMFYSFLLSVAFNLVNLFMSFHYFFSGLLNVFIGALIGAYILFELKPYFVKVAKAKKS
jgi:hypothetical protein